MIAEVKILRRLGKQFIPDVTKPQVPGPFKGRPEISSEPVDEEALAALCPTGAIGKAPVSIDLGKCVMCGECAFRFPGTPAGGFSLNTIVANGRCRCEPFVNVALFQQVPLLGRPSPDAGKAVGL